LERELLQDVKPRLPQAMRQRILIDFLKVPVPMITMDGKRRFSHKIT
jgi:hypothetical protein